MLEEPEGQALSGEVASGRDNGRDNGLTASGRRCRAPRAPLGSPWAEQRQSFSMPEWTTDRMSASWSSGEGRRSFARRKVSIVSWTTLPAHSGSADSFFSR